MINYEHLSKWTQVMTMIEIQEHCMQNNLYLYLLNKDIKHLEVMTEQIKRIIKLKSEARELYKLAFTQE